MTFKKTSEWLYELLEEHFGSDVESQPYKDFAAVAAEVEWLEEANGGLVQYAIGAKRVASDALHAQADKQERMFTPARFKELSDAADEELARRRENPFGGSVDDLLKKLQEGALTRRVPGV